jgi:uncharacterized protein YfiM (DUF2279 family)
MRVLLLVFSLHGVPSVASVASADRWFSADKLEHFLSAAFVQSLAYGSLRGVGASHGAAMAGASVTTAVVGVGKEIHDARTGGDPSLRDLAWDAAGAGTMSVLLSHSAR